MSAAERQLASFRTPTTPAWTTPGSYVGEVVVSGDTALSYVRGGNEGLQIVAVDVATGAERWRRDAAVGTDPGGVTIRPAVAEAGGHRYTAFLTPVVRDDWQQLTIVDVATGVGQPVGVNTVWANWPSTCGDHFCFNGWLNGNTTDEAQYQVAATGGAVTPDRSRPLPKKARLLGEHVYSTGDRPPNSQELLGYLADGKSQWTRPYTDVFGANASSDAGWAWLDDDAEKTIVGSGFSYDPALATKPDQFSSDKMTQRVVGLDVGTGATQWAVQGGEFCGDGLPDTDTSATVPLCQFEAGRTDYAKKTDGTYAVTRVGWKVSAVGVDRHTGQVKWEVPLDDATFPVQGATVNSPFGAGPWLVVTGGAKSLLDISTGSSIPVSDDATMACSADRDVLKLRRSWQKQADIFSPGSDTVPCSAALAKTNTFSVGAVQSTGPAVDGWRVLATPQGLQGFHV